MSLIAPGGTPLLDVNNWNVPSVVPGELTIESDPHVARLRLRQTHAATSLSATEVPGEPAMSMTRAVR